MKIFPIHRLNKDTRFSGNIPATNQTKENKNCTLKDLRNLFKRIKGYSYHYVII